MSQTGESGTLNVIFHGTFAFHLQTTKGAKPKGYDVLIPNLPREHVYRAGNWLGETELQSGHYELEGVYQGDKTLSAERNLIIGCKNRSATSPYATLFVELPRAIASLRRANVPRSHFKVKRDVPDDYNDQIATLQVFTYSFKDIALLKLKAKEPKVEKAKGQKEPGHFWEPTFAGDTVNLHIFSAHDHHHNPDHPDRAFKTVLKLFKDVELELNKSQPVDRVEVNELPPGVTPEETEDLAPRMKRLARLGRMRTDERDLNQLWYESDALDSDPQACLCFGCK